MAHGEKTNTSRCGSQAKKGRLRALIGRNTEFYDRKWTNEWPLTEILSQWFRPPVSEEGLLWVTVRLNFGPSTCTSRDGMTGGRRVLHLGGTIHQGSNQSRADMPGARTDAYQFRYDQNPGTEIIPISRGGHARERSSRSISIVYDNPMGSRRPPSSQPCSNI